MKIAVIGGNDFALANAYFLASRQHDVTWVCENEETSSEFNQGSLVTYDESIRAIHSSGRLPLKAEHSVDYADFQMIVLAQNYRLFNEGVVLLDKTMHDIYDRADSTGNSPLVVIRSPVPVGYLESNYGANANIVYVPQFERSKQWFYDLVHSADVVLGGYSALVSTVIRAFEFTSHHALSLFESVVYQTAFDMRAAMTQVFLNEVESLSYYCGSNAGNVIEALQKTIPDTYGNPNFGYGDRLHQVVEGYSKQNRLPLFAALSASNKARSIEIAERIVAHQPEEIYFYLIEDASSQGYDGPMINLVLEVQKLCQESAELRNTILIVYDPNLGAMPDWFKGTHIRELDVGNLGSSCVLVVETGNAVTDYAASMGIRTLTCEYKIY